MNSLQCVERSLLPKAKISSTTHVQLLQWLQGKQQQHLPSELQIFAFDKQVEHMVLLHREVDPRQFSWGQGFSPHFRKNADLQAINSWREGLFQGRGSGAALWPRSNPDPV